MAQFITVNKTSSDYRSYLSGAFSRTERALPVPALDGVAPGDQATFQIVAKTEIPKTRWLAKLVKLYRPDLIGFTFLPVALTALWAGAQSFKMLLLLPATMLFHGAVFAFNDYFDHMQGVDRMSEKRGTRLIQSGHVRAVDVLRLAWIYWALAILAGLPIILENPKVLYFLGTGVILGTIGSTYSRFGVKALAINDLTVFICLGPLLVGGVAFAVSGHITVPHLVLGSAFGLIATVYLHARHLSSAMTDYRAGVQTLAVRLGFDRIKTLLVIEVAMVFGIYAFLAGLHWQQPLFSAFAPALLVVGFAVFTLLRKIIDVRSPASSAAEALPQLVARAQLWIVIFLYLVIR